MSVFKVVFGSWLDAMTIRKLISRFKICVILKVESFLVAKA